MKVVSLKREVLADFMEGATDVNNYRYQSTVLVSYLFQGLGQPGSTLSLQVAPHCNWSCEPRYLPNSKK